MSLGQQLAPHLPFLRRYARALTGSQNHGDAYVRAALEAVSYTHLDVYKRQMSMRMAACGSVSSDNSINSVNRKATGTATS